MRITLDVPEYDSNIGIKYKWEPNSTIEMKIENGEIIFIANEEGLISMANHFLNLAQAAIPSGYHLHFDQYNALEDDSIGLVIQKK